MADKRKTGARMQQRMTSEPQVPLRYCTRCLQRIEPPAIVDGTAICHKNEDFCPDCVDADPILAKVREQLARKKKVEEAQGRTARTGSSARLKAQGQARPPAERTAPRKSATDATRRRSEPEPADAAPLPRLPTGKTQRRSPTRGPGQEAERGLPVVGLGILGLVIIMLLTVLIVVISSRREQVSEGGDVDLGTARKTAKTPAEPPPVSPSKEKTEVARPRRKTKPPRRTARRTTRRTTRRTRRKTLEERTPVAPGDAKFFGNRRSLKLHRPECRWGRKMSPGNRVGFATLKEALGKGFKPCRDCLRD